MIFKCFECEYISTLKSNVKRHAIRIHGKYENPEDTETQNTVIETQNTVIDEQTETDNKKCMKCNKILSSINALNRHIKICKGIVNSLECHLCHKIFTNSGNKSRHIKICTGGAIITTNNNIDNSQNADIINNTTNNNITNIMNNNIMNNTNNITNNIIVYNDENIEFKDDHITKKDLKRIFNGASVKTIQAITEYALKLLENVENLCVHKKHLTNSYCEVHAGNGEWKTRPEQVVLERFSQDVAISANDKLYDNPTIGTEKVRNEITDIASELDEAHSQTIKLRRELRSVIIDKSKQQSTNDPIIEYGNNI